MSKSLVIVESPAKAKTISKFLGKDFEVLACKGHIRALPSKPGSVEISDDIIPNYQVLPGSSKYLKDIKKAAKGAETLYLATDLDREGEAIAWHLLEALNFQPGQKPTKRTIPDIKRITFHEITKEAITEALASPSEISINLVDAQQARVVLDYLVGFNLSPFLWKKIRYGLSAGRVQSVALRLICEREKEIKAFIQQEYWSIVAQLTPLEQKSPFKAQLIEAGGEKIDKLSITSEQQAQDILHSLENANYIVRDVKKREIRRTPPAPFITSTLQQEASRKLGFSTKRTMSVAQKLYEGIDVGSGTTGLITYMRTDSTELADSALKDIHNVIVREYGQHFALEKPRTFRKKSKNAQEAHEAVRPTDAALLPDNIKHALSPDEYKLYSLIWRRAVASQMAQAIIDSVSADIAAGTGYTFRATGSTIKFPGFMQLYIEGKDIQEEDEKENESMLPVLVAGQKLDLLDIEPHQHFTQPPPRFTEASLVKTLEEYGIGRPSTYASIISVLQAREYVRLEKKRFIPADVGMVVSDLLVNHFSRYVDYGFTSHLEDQLDAISRGEAEWKPAVLQWWKPFIELIHAKDKEVQKADVTTEKTEEICPDCGKELVIKLGKYGRFFACSGFPDCRYVRPLPGENGETAEAAQVTDETCETCGAPLLLRQGKYGQFYGCSKYPACKFIRPLNKPVEVGVKCPDCSAGDVLEKKSRRGKIFYSCSRYPTCSFASWDKPIDEHCPKCESRFLVENTTKRWGRRIKCPNKSCKYTRALEAIENEE
jgi:DNA topoisomerase-1